MSTTLHVNMETHIQSSQWMFSDHVSDCGWFWMDAVSMYRSLICLWKKAWVAWKNRLGTRSLYFRLSFASVWHESDACLAVLAFQYLVQRISMSSSDCFHCYNVDGNMLIMFLNENELKILRVMQSQPTFARTQILGMLRTQR